MADKDPNEGLFPRLIEIYGSKSETERTVEKVDFPEILPGIIEIQHNDETIRVSIPPLGFNDYYSLIRSISSASISLSASELSSLFLEAYKKPFQSFGNCGRVKGLDSLVSAGKVLQLVPKLVTPGDIIRNERIYSSTGLLYVPSKMKVFRYNGGVFVFEITDPRAEINVNCLASNQASGIRNLRFVPAELIPRGKYNDSDRVVQNDHRILTRDELLEDGLANAILNPYTLSQIRESDDKRDTEKPNFHLFYHHPEKIDTPYQAVVSMRQSNNTVMINASNRSIGNPGFDALSRMPLLARGFMFCKV
jgi:hypothetical protein